MSENRASAINHDLFWAIAEKNPGQYYEYDQWHPEILRDIGK
jgi:hypothetical protein